MPVVTEGSAKRHAVRDVALRQMDRGQHVRGWLLAAATVLGGAGVLAQPLREPALDIPGLLQIIVGEDTERAAALAELAASGDPSLTPMILELLQFAPSSVDAQALYDILRTRSGARLGNDYDAWWRWWWAQKAPLHAEYGEFKAALYQLIDPRFEAYFRGRGLASAIRLDEVRWGGVGQDGIPPLRSPRMLRAQDANYLDDANVVFGIEVNGDVRAYPKRILAWHEMFVDTVGGVPVTGVYCTLCESMILYESRIGATVHELGTSGFLWRSNKVMYDRATQSLWNTLWGVPVHGPLAGKGLELTRRAAVTTTWGEWRRRHPQTQVLDLNTGHVRDYGEGVAYREYLASDELMFAVPVADTRLQNKDQVLALLPRAARGQALAIAAAYLRAHPLYELSLGGLRLVVLTDRSGANRVYETGELRFTAWDGSASVSDASGQRWRLQEDALIGPQGKRLPRYPAHRAFWFGWRAAYPDTALVH